MICAVVFDMDGVLIDAKEWHFEALNKALSLFGCEISRYDHLITYDGLSTSDKLKMLTLQKGLPKKLHSFINTLKQDYTMNIVYDRLRPSFIHEYALSRLQSEGYRLVVASNSVRETVDVMMKKSGLSNFIEFFLSNQDVIRSKPDPEIYNLAISKLGLKPEECLIIEDNAYGIKAARASGGYVMEVTSVHDVYYQNIISHIQKINVQEASI